MFVFAVNKTQTTPMLQPLGNEVRSYVHPRGRLTEVRLLHP